MLEMLQDHRHWPDGTALLPNDCDTTFTALGIPIMLDDLQCFAFPNTNSRPSSGFLSGAAINFALASLAADFNNHPRSELHQISHDTVAVPPHFSGLLASEERIQFMIERLADHFNPRITSRLIVPTNLCSTHWLIFILDFSTQTLHSRDSCQASFPIARLAITNTLKLVAQEICRMHRLPVKWTTEIDTVPQQDNGYDCGPHTICNCTLLAAESAQNALPTTNLHQSLEQVRGVRLWLFWKLIQHLPPTPPDPLPDTVTHTTIAHPALPNHQSTHHTSPQANLPAVSEPLHESICHDTVPTNVSHQHPPASTTMLPLSNDLTHTSLYSIHPDTITWTAPRVDLQTAIHSCNVGPSGISDSLLHMLPLFKGNPGMVMVQDARLTGRSVQNFKALAHKLLPEYAIFTRTSAKTKHDTIRVVTFVHLALAARGTQIDIHKMTSPHPTCPIEDLATRIQVIKTTDVHTETNIIWINIYQYQASQPVAQQALLDLITHVIQEWSHKVQHIICGGDFNASLSQRVGYSAASLTTSADARLSAWLSTNAAPLNLQPREPNEPTWLSPSEDHQAVLDRFLVSTSGASACLVSAQNHVVHDHKVISITVGQEIVTLLPPKCHMIRPKRLKMNNWLQRRDQWATMVSSNIRQHAIMNHDPLSKASAAQEIALKAAEQVLGMSGGKKVSLIPFHSSGYKKLVAKLRIVKAARTDLLKRRNLGPTAPSKAMRMTWDQGILPVQKMEYSALNHVYSANYAKWTKEWLEVLRDRFAHLSNELRTLRHSEIKSAAQHSREARIERMSTGGSGEIQRLLGKKGPAIWAPFITTDYPDRAAITCPDYLTARLLCSAVASLTPSPKTSVEEGGLSAHTVLVTEICPSLLPSVLGLAEGQPLTLSTAKPQLVHTDSDRLTAWESHLSKEADATRSRCCNCNGADTIPVSIVVPTREIRHFCTSCCKFVQRTVDTTEYDELPFTTDSIPKVPPDANESLAGEISLDDLRHRITQLARGKAPGDDGVPYEFLKDGPEELLSSVLDAVNALLTRKARMPADWKGGSIRLLFKKGDPSMCKNYRPVVLLRACYKIYTSILTDRLYNIAERHNLLHDSQEGFRRHHSCGRQAQSLFWAYQEAKRRKESLVVTFLDFANAFNSVDHAALWKWLRTLGVPDVDLLEDIYTNSYYSAETPHGTTAKIFLTRGTKQGDGLSPLLFSLIFNYLLHALAATGVGHKSTTGLRTPSRAFADDVALVTTSTQDTSALLQVITKFCGWSGMRLNASKSEISAWDFKLNSEPDVSLVTVNGQPLPRLPPTKAFRYLGFRFSLLGAWGEEINHVIATTRDLLPVVTKHGYTLRQMTEVIHSVATARFRYSAALVPWTDGQLNKLHKLWIRLQKGAWRLPPSFPGAVFLFPEEHGGLPVPHPKVFLLQALALHVEQLALWDDDVLACARLQYTRLRSSFGCHSQAELTQALLQRPRSSHCPIARLLRLAGELDLQAKIPALITGEEQPNLLSWFGLKQRISIAMDHDLACPVLLRRKGESALQKWESAVAALRLPTPTALHWKMTDNGPTWIIPPFQGRTLHSNFAATIERWGNPSRCDLKRQLLGSPATLTGEAPIHSTGNSYPPPPVSGRPEVLDGELTTVVLDDITARTEHTGDYVITTAKALARVDRREGNELVHLCTISQARLGFLRDQDSDCLSKLATWVRMTERAEESKGCLSPQAYFFLQAGTGANLLIGVPPLVASTVFASAWTNTSSREGWTATSGEIRPLINMFSMSETDQSATLQWLNWQQPRTWYVLTRARSCSAATRQELAKIGCVVCTVKRGQPLLQRTGNWRNGGIKTALSKEDWLLWGRKGEDSEETLRLSQLVSKMPLSSTGHAPFHNNRLFMREAIYGPAGPYYDLAGVVAATDGSVRSDGRMGSAAVFFHNRMATLKQAVHGEPSSTTAELTALAMIVHAAPLNEPLTVLTDSLTSMQNLMSMKRSDFCKDLHQHPQRQLINELVGALNRRSQAGASSLFVKIRAHKGEPLNEAADEAADEAAEYDPPATTVLDPSRCYFLTSEGHTEPWGSRLRRLLVERLASKLFADTQQRKISLDDQRVPPSPCPKKLMNHTETFLSRQDCSRELLGKTLRLSEKTIATKRILMAVGNTFPVQSKLYLWGLSSTPSCRLCCAEQETLCHTQCLCSALTPARIAAHHHCWACLFNQIVRNAGPAWMFASEMTISSLTALAAPPHLSDRNVEWARLADGLDDGILEIEGETDEAVRELSDLARNIQARFESRDAAGLTRLLISSGTLLSPACTQDPVWVAANAQNPEQLLHMIDVEINQLKTGLAPCLTGRKRPDGIALNWKDRRVYLLEFTRCFDSDHAALERSDSYKTGKYSPLLQMILSRLGHSWSGAVLSFSAGIRGSIRANVWTSHLKVLGLNTSQARKVLEQSVAAILEAIDVVFNARSTALAALNNG